ncbi:MAG TPA: site-specific integrase [Nitrospiraceae bacterium]|nr:site-specific integrase [Nitrospiraceae bacterium]
MARMNSRDRGVTFKEGAWWTRLYLHGRERWYRCDNKTQAKALYGRLKGEQREGKLFDKQKPAPFKELADDYHAIVDARRRRSGDDHARLSRWKAVFGDQDANTITARQIERVLADLQNEGRLPATVLRYLTVLKAVFNRGKRLGVLRENPSSRVQTPKPNNVLVRYLIASQEADLLASLPARFHPIVATALHTGLRQGELLRLRWADIDWTVGVLTIHETKAGERRRVPMNSVMQTLLTGMRDTEKPASTDRVFPHDQRYLRRIFAKAVARAGLAPFRFHDLRHTFASRLAMNGANDRTLMALGGWKSPRMLDRYAHLSPAHLWQAIEGLAQTRTGSKTGSAGESLTEEDTQPTVKTGAGNGI